MPDLTGLAIDLGGSHAACAVVRKGAILARCDVDASGGEPFAKLLPKLSAAFEELLRQAKVERAECAALVLGFCGIVSAREKRVLAVNGKFLDAPDLDIEGWCKQNLGLPFLIENDARLALLGEHGYGAARGAHDAVMITLGTGVGGAALLDGRLLQSRHGLAGTIGGHLPLVLDGRQCSCGNIGCADCEASTAFLTEIYAAQPGAKQGKLNGIKAIGFAELFKAVDESDKPAQAALDRCLKVWSALTVGLIHVYDPEVVVFGGSVMKRAGDILPRLQEYVCAHAWTPGRVVPLRAAELGGDAALLGAIPLIKSSL